jgi:hypothetical protein
MNTAAEILAQVDVVRLRLHLEFDEDCLRPPGFALHLRRELIQAGRMILERDVLRSLFEPALPEDAAVVRRYQRPAPAFVIKAESTAGKSVSAGDEWPLDVLFVGTGVTFIPDFIRVFQQLGQTGIAQGRGRFVVVATSSLGASGEATEIRMTGRDRVPQELQPIPLAWLVESTRGVKNLRFELMTPARLVSHGKPLFHPAFTALFPFILRRIGAMLSHWGDGSFEMDPQPYLAAADRVEVVVNRLHWQDWRPFPGVSGEEALGGISGSLVVSGSALDDIYWILGLGALLHMGKGAAYGAGQYRLTGA